MKVPFRQTKNSRLVLGDSITVQVVAKFAKAALGLLKKNQDVTVDCAQTQYLDGAILQQIALLAISLRSQDKHLRLEGASPALVRDFKLAGFPACLWEGNGV